jgi:hypothetical protein
MIALRSSISILGCLGIAWAAQPALTREGQYWVEVLTGSQTVASAPRIRIASRGAVNLTGGPGSAVSYVLKVRVKARNEAQARDMMRAFTVRIVKPGTSYASLIVERGDGMADLQVKVPRAAPEAVIITPEGALDIRDLDGSARAETGGGAITADRIGGNLVARTAGGDIALGTIQGNAHCVTAGGKITAVLVRGEVTFDTGGGDILAEEVGGLAHVTTQAGTIRVRRAGAAVIASTGGGPIDVGQARGLVTARNSGGPVKVGAAEGVQCDSAGGGVRIDKVSGPVHVTTAMGNINANLLGGRSMMESSLSTRGGDITVVIPSNLGVTIRAQNDLSDSIRRIISDFPGIAVKMRGGQVVAEGSVNGGGPILKIADAGGTIFIKRQ